MLQVPHQMLNGKDTFEPRRGEQRQEMVIRGAQVKSQGAVCLGLWSARTKDVYYQVLLTQGTGWANSSREALAAGVSFCSALVGSPLGTTNSPSFWCPRGLSQRSKGEVMGPIMKGLEGLG